MKCTELKKPDALVGLEELDYDWLSFTNHFLWSLLMSFSSSFLPSCPPPLSFSPFLSSPALSGFQTAINSESDAGDTSPKYQTVSENRVGEFKLFACAHKNLLTGNLV